MQDIIQTINPGDIPTVAALYFFLGTLMITGLIFDVVLLVRFRHKPLKSPDLIAKLQSRPWTWNEGGFLLLTLVFLHGCLLLSVKAEHHFYLIKESEIPFVSLFLQTVLFHGAGLIVIVSLMRSQKMSWQRAFGLNPRDFLKNIRQGVVFYIAVIPIIAFCSLVYMKLLEHLHYPIDGQDIIQLLADPQQPAWLHVYLGVLAIVVAPLIEELIFRGIALTILVKHLKLMPSVYLVSLVFAAMHFHPASIMALFILAVAFSLAYLYSGSIAVPMVMHTLFNATSLIAVLLIRNTPGFTICQ